VSPPPPRSPTPSGPVWWEIGRPSPEQASNWITWVAPMDDRGTALYRSVVVADDSITVAVDLHRHQGSEHRTIHRGRCGLPQDPEPISAQVNALLKAADEAVAKALQPSCGGKDVLPKHRGRPPSWRVSGTPEDERQDDTSVVGHVPEHHLRERAYFLWEREGRPEGRAHEFWDRARQEEARAA
jgi:hypothetical protein